VLISSGRRDDETTADARQAKTFSNEGELDNSAENV